MFKAKSKVKSALADLSSAQQASAEEVNSTETIQVLKTTTRQRLEDIERRINALKEEVTKVSSVVMEFKHREYKERIAQLKVDLEKIKKRFKTDSEAVANAQLVHRTTTSITSLSAIIENMPFESAGTNLQGSASSTSLHVSGAAQNLHSSQGASHQLWAGPAQAQTSTGTLHPQGYSFGHGGHHLQSAQGRYSTAPHAPFLSHGHSPHDPRVKVAEPIISASERRDRFPDLHLQYPTSYAPTSSSSHSTRHSDERSLRRQSEQYEQTPLPPYPYYQPRDIHQIPGNPYATHLQQPAEFTASPGTSAGPSQDPSAGHRSNPSNASSYYAPSSHSQGSNASSYHATSSQMSRTPSQYSHLTNTSNVSGDSWFKQMSRTHRDEPDNGSGYNPGSAGYNPGSAGYNPGSGGY